MVLFHAVSSFQLILVTLLKVKYHKKENSVLVISKDIVDRLNNYKDFNYFFNEIWVYDNGEGNRIISRKENIVEYYDDLFKKHNSKIENYYRIYLGCAHHSFGIYVARKNIDFIFLEDGVGMLSQPEVLQNIENKSKIKNDIAIKYGLYNGNNDRAISCIYNKNFQMDGFKHLEKYIHFDVYEELLNLDIESRNYLISIFTDKINIDCKKNSALILTEQFANLGLFSWEEQILIYQLIIDYFFYEYYLIFKPHPDDIMYYKYLFPNSYIIKGRFPAEILPFIFKEKPKIIGTASSTSINTLTSYFENTISFNYEFTHYKKQFKKLHKIYVALKIAEKQNVDIIYTIGLNKLIIENFIKLDKINISRVCSIDSIEEYININKGILIIDDYQDINENMYKLLEEISKDSMIILIDKVAYYSCYNPFKKNLVDYIYSIEIEKYKTHEVVYDDLQNEQIYCYKKNDFDLEPISINLKNTGLIIKAKKLEDEERLISILNFCISSINARLIELIDKNDFIEKKENFNYISLENSYGFFNKYNSKQINVLKGILLASEKRYVYYKSPNK